MVQRRSIHWGSLLGGMALIGLGGLLLVDQSKNLPNIIQRYWPIYLIAWGVWSLIGQIRIREDLWAGTDYGTGLYVIRHRRRQRSHVLPGIGLLFIGGFFLWANFDPGLGIAIGPIVLIGFGVIILVRSILFL